MSVKMEWKEANELALDLVKKVHEYTPDYYNQVERVGYLLLGRGGLAVGSMMARHLDMRYVIYLPVNRGDFFQWFKVWYRSTWADIVRGLSVDTLVLVDDINDTGETFQEVLKLLYSHSSGKEYLLLSLVKRKTSKMVGTYYAKLVEDKEYIVFPWEEFDEVKKEEVPF